MATEPTLAGYTEEILAELDAFDRDLGKLYERMAEIYQDASSAEEGKPLWDFRQAVEAARERVSGAWLGITWAKQQITGN